MITLRKMARSATLAVGVLVSASALPPAAYAAAPTPPERAVVGLNNPKQLDLTRNGILIIAESGTGGKDCANVDGQQVCVGTTASVSAVRNPSTAREATPERIVTGLLSEAGPDGNRASGNDGVSARSLGQIYIAKDVDVPDGITGLPEEQEGKLLRATPGQGRSPSVVADIRAYETANDPDGQGVESNPYAVLDLGDRVLVADAAGNDILAVDRQGRISVFALLPNITGGACDTRQNQGGFFCDPVPTSLTFSRDGDVIVAGLGSLVTGAGRVWELDRRNGQIQRTWTGFTGVTGAAQDRDGNLYVSELFNRGGQVVLVPPSGTGAGGPTLPVPAPAGVVADPTGNVYVAANSLSAGNGQVWRLSRRSF